jgi:hypothetical protein
VNRTSDGSIGLRNPSLGRHISVSSWSFSLPGAPQYRAPNFWICFSSDFNYFVVDERNRFRPAGIGRFARSKGGSLQDDPRAGRFMTVGSLESWLFELAAVEQGAVVQNLGLMGQALGLGGFPHFAAHPFGWTQALEFRMEEPGFSRTVAASPRLKLALKASGKDIPIPHRSMIFAGAGDLGSPKRWIRSLTSRSSVDYGTPFIFLDV